MGAHLRPEFLYFLTHAEIYLGKFAMFAIKKSHTLSTMRLEPINQQINQSRLGASLFVKGEISGNEDLLVDGSVEGIVQLNEQKLIIGPTAQVRAEIMAGEVIVSGNLKGNVHAKDHVEIRHDGSVTGDLTTPQIFIEQGAWFKGSVEIEKSTEREISEKAVSEL